MINIFDFSAGVAGNKMLTERPHRDAGFPVNRNKHDARKATTPSGTKADDKQIANDLKQNLSSKKASGTPMKMLIAQEMSKETESIRKPPSVVARLMGLDDDLTGQPFPMSSQRKLLEGYPQRATAGVNRDHRQRQDVFNKAVPYQHHRHDHEKMEHRDVRKVWQQPSWSRNGRCGENQTELRMALVRQKFMEAKRLAAHENLLHTKEFQDALEVLSSNRDLFLKFLEEPNSLLSKQTSDLHSIPPPPQTKRITVLKPSKKVETKFEKVVKKHENSEIDESGLETNNHHWEPNFNHLNSESFFRPTRIVVLKPSTGNPTKLPTSTMSPEYLARTEVYGHLGVSEAFESRSLDKERAEQMQKSLTGHRRDESLLSSMYSNGYGGDASSFNQSETDYNVEDGGFSDSGIVTPTSRHSWDKFGSLGSPYSASSFSRVSYSPESSVIREAKKRLSERWALVTSNGISEEQLQLPRSSSTLGEMLAIPEVKREEFVDGFTVSSNKPSDGEDELRSPAFCSSVGRTKDSGDLSPGNLSRSKSVPVSSTAYEVISLKFKGSESQISRSTVSEVSKTKHGKSSFRGKVSSFFFSRSKKTNREGPVSSTLVDSREVVSRSDEIQKSADISLSVDSQVKDEEQSADVPSPISATNVTEKVMPSLEEPRTCDKSREKEKLSPCQNFINNLDQPSPTSILDATFEDDMNENLCQLSEANAGQQLLSRASPIESVARSLSWDDAHLGTLSPRPSNLYKASSKADHTDQDYFVFVQNLLYFAGLEKSDMIFTGWHSLDSPLDPMLLDKFLGWKEEEPRCTEKSSTLRLLFDCVNSALEEVSWTTLTSLYLWNGASCGSRINAGASSTLSEAVWSLMRDWYSGNGISVFAETDNNSLGVDRALRREVEGNKWVESIRIEVEEITGEISGEVLKDLVVEALADLPTACIC
ncbi:unnamed protein product [Musa acuminata subsp. malaccensis]|uniref:(wild Malaysian banana) hypothetical protein n=1 Tax=Musa acuminata subsp. malaccensis TaxID=214687 RepID=A0A8D7EWM1_MUSAM|nr:unnamed protein product [Musa acuminata subsp. malaccensis]